MAVLFSYDSRTLRHSMIAFLFAIMTFWIGKSYGQVTYEPNAPISANREKAAVLYQRLTGIKISIDADVIKQMEAELNAGRPMDAAAIATSTPQFYNNTVRLFGQRLTTKETTYKAPFTDMSATIVGIAKDGRDIRDMLTSDDVYRVNLTGAPMVLVTDILSSNNHYTFAEQAITVNPSLDIRPSLAPVRQQILTDGAVAVNNPDPAGVLTSRAFMDNCANMGTNRRCYEEIMKKFMCIGLEEFADTSAPDGMVGIDVTRTPGNDPNLFQTSCRGCHGNMDTMRPAFAYFEFDPNNGGRVKQGQINNGNLFDNTTNVAVKYNRGAATGNPNGFRVIDNTWQNNAVTGSVGEYFGWRDNNGAPISTPITGAGANSFGRMVANSQAFTRCMVKKSFITVCRRSATNNDVSAIRTIASEFESPIKGNRKLKWLFERVATDSACVGQ